MSALEASVISPRTELLNITVVDGPVVHRFTVTELDTSYEIRNDNGELIAIADATCDINMIDVDSIAIKIKTRSHIIEFVKADNYSYKAHKQAIK